MVRHINVGGKCEIVKRIARVASGRNGAVNWPTVNFTWIVCQIGGRPLSSPFDRLADANEFIYQREVR